jgi:hypothetical protein
MTRQPLQRMLQTAISEAFWFLGNSNSENVPKSTEQVMATGLSWLQIQSL